MANFPFFVKTVFPSSYFSADIIIVNWQKVNENTMTITEILGHTIPINKKGGTHYGLQGKQEHRMHRSAVC